MILTIVGAHVAADTAPMFPFFEAGQPKMLSGVGILANAEISNFTNIILNAARPIAEPGTLLLLGLDLVGIGVGARRRDRKKP